MTQQKKSIPNPNKISHTEQSFISLEDTSENILEEINSKDQSSLFSFSSIKRIFSWASFSFAASSIHLLL